MVFARTPEPKLIKAAPEGTAFIIVMNYILEIIGRLEGYCAATVQEVIIGNSLKGGS